MGYLVWWMLLGGYWIVFILSLASVVVVVAWRSGSVVGLDKRS